jgi:hypothetical protein
MKNVFALLLIFSAFFSNAQRTMFGAQNNFVAPSIVYPTTISNTTGLVLFLDADNSSSYPGAGNTWFDISGSNNHIYWTSPAPQFTIDNGIKVIKTTNTLGTLRAMTSTTYTNFPLGNTPYTAIAFFKPNSTASARILLSAGPADNSCGGTQIHSLGIGPGGKYSGGACGGLGTWSNSQGTTPATGAYVCIATTYGNSTEKVYVNGNLDKTSSLSVNIPNTAANKVCIGWVRDDGAGYTLDANIAMILFFNRELSQAEISQIFNDNKAKYNIN